MAGRPGRPASTRIPAIVRETADDALLRDALLENLHRAQLNPLEEAAAYQQLLDDFGCTHEELAQPDRPVAGRRSPTRCGCCGCPPSVQRRVAAGVLSAGHARALLGLLRATPRRRRWSGSPTASSPRGCRCARSRRSSPSAGTSRARQKRRKPANRPTAPGLDDLADRLSDRLETRVRVEMGRTKGKIVIEFASMDDLRRIVEVVDPQG